MKKHKTYLKNNETTFKNVTNKFNIFKKYLIQGVLNYQTL